MSTRYVERKTEGRRLSDPRETFDWTTPNLEVTANPTDPYVSPAVNPQTIQLAQALNLFQNTATQYGTFKDKQNKEDYKKGQVSRAAGEEADPSKGAAFIKGYEELDGELRASTGYHNEVETLVTTHRDKSPEEFETALNTLTQRYLAESTTEDSKKGFVLKAIEVETQARQAYDEYQRNTQRTKTAASVVQLDKSNITNLIKSELGLGDMDQLISDPMKYKDYYENKHFGNNFLMQGGKYIDEQLGKQYPLLTEKERITLLFDNVLEPMADLYDMPEVLMLMENKDKNGKTLLDKVPELYEKYAATLEKVMGEKDRRLVTSNTKYDQDAEKRTQLKMNDWWAQVGDITNSPDRVVKAKLLKESIRRDSEANTYASLAPLYDTLDKLIDNPNPKYSSPTAQKQLDQLMLRGELTQDVLFKNMGNLDEVDFNKYRAVLKSQEDQEKRTAMALKKMSLSDYKTFKRNLRGDVIGQIRSNVALVKGGLEDPAGVVATAEVQLYMMINQAEDDHGALNINDIKEIRKFFKENYNIDTMDSASLGFKGNTSLAPKGSGGSSGGNGKPTPKPINSPKPTPKPRSNPKPTTTAPPRKNTQPQQNRTNNNNNSYSKQDLDFIRKAKAKGATDEQIKAYLKSKQRKK